MRQQDSSDSMNDRNRYQTPFDEIIPIKFAETCQKGRAFAGRRMKQFLDAIDDQDACMVFIAPPWQCEGKNKYPSYTVALTAIIGRRASCAKKGGNPVDLYYLHPYFCLRCHSWHIGHRPGSFHKIEKAKRKFHERRGTAGQNSSGYNIR